MDLNSSDDYEFEEYDYDEADYDDDEYDDAPVDHDFNSALAAKFDDLDLPPGVEATVPWLQKQPVGDLLGKNKVVEVTGQIDVKYRAFKQFDTVREYSDHYFSNLDSIKNPMVCQKPSKDWAKRIQHEWKILEKDLPDTIYVRIYEDRMDLLRAVIVGPAGTPYHDGLFFFDIYFPPPYPNLPPMVHYRSGGLRLNPNLYACGKVCLSLLNTWSGHGCEKWSPSNSTMLQVLVSIQALVLNAKPYFNEPGYASLANTPQGEEKSLLYNEDTFILSLRTMLFSLRNPPEHFKDFVAGHFRNCGHSILLACKAYLNGVEVGSNIEKAAQKANEGRRSHSAMFKSSLNKLFDDLLMEFSVKGADCDDFLAQKVKDGAAKAEEITSQQ
nr:unnamed protein product [Ananas comosus var. bracteatus]